MSTTVLHHIEVCVKDDRLIHQLIQGFGFTPFAYRVTKSATKIALKCLHSIFIVVKRNEINSLGYQNGHCIYASTKEDFEHSYPVILEPDKNNYNSLSLETKLKAHLKDENEHWTVFCCEGKSVHTVDSVFNVAFVIQNVDGVTNRILSKGGSILREPCSISDNSGFVRYSIVGTPCGNIVHTLLNKKSYSGQFLPGYEILNDYGKNNSIFQSLLEKFNIQSSSPFPKHLISNLNNTELSLESGKNNSIGSRLSTHIDHVTYVCEVGKSKDLIDWYECCFGMKRFLTNRKESEEEGFVLRDNIGLRLKVLEYWRCAESGLSTTESNQSESSFKLVIAEPLIEVSTSHVNTFLKAHNGPGIQHIALHTPTITTTVDSMTKNGVVFRKVPSLYYEEGIKLKEIREAGYSKEVDLFKRLGLLLDTEADVFTENEENDGIKRYLMQVFTGPLFDEDTFFLEVIQRCGARGFGAGNITALARSIILYNQQISKDSETNNS